MNSFSRRDIFKKRKNKAYKNLVSYGQYGVLTALSLASIATGGLVQAETATNSPETVLTAPTYSRSTSRGGSYLYSSIRGCSKPNFIRSYCDRSGKRSSNTCIISISSKL